MHVNFGCGGNVIHGWKNHDAEVDIRVRLPYDDQSVEFVLAEHVAEHISGPECLRFFDEVKRILVPGGTFRVCIPCIDRVGFELGRDLVLNHGHLAPYTEDSVYHMLRLAGFGRIVKRPFNPNIDGHWRVIGIERDSQETVRFEATNLGGEIPP